MASQRWWRDSALNLAAFRVVVAFVLLSSRDLRSAADWAALPPPARVIPGGLGPLLASLPVSPEIVRIALLVMVASLLCALVGFWSRTANALTTLLGFYVMGVPQLSGTVVHYHHLLWFTALLAASCCGDALSIDAWLAKRRGQELDLGHSPVYGVPIRCAWLLLGLVYFFPGLWKLRESGWAWIWSDNLRNQFYWKWLQHDAIPWLRVDRYPLLCRLGALSVVAFELSFPLLVLWRRTRLWAALLGLLLHLSAAVWMHIHFAVLWWCYAVFIDWSRWQRTLPPEPRVSRQWIPAALVGAALLITNATYGWTGSSQAWPFACYPTFQWTASATMPALQMELVQPDGTTQVIPDSWLIEAEGATRHWGTSWSLAGVTATTGATRLEAYWKHLQSMEKVRTAARDAHAVRFHRALLSVVPEERDRPPQQRELLYELALDSRSPVTENPRAFNGATTFDSSDRAASAR